MQNRVGANVSEQIGTVWNVWERGRAEPPSRREGPNSPSEDALGSFFISRKLVNSGKWRSTPVNGGQRFRSSFSSGGFCRAVFARTSRQEPRPPRTCLPISRAVAHFGTDRATVCASAVGNTERFIFSTPPFSGIHPLRESTQTAQREIICSVFESPGS